MGSTQGLHGPRGPAWLTGSWTVLGQAQLGSAGLGWARPGWARLGSAGLGWARLSSAGLGWVGLSSARLDRLGSARPQRSRWRGWWRSPSAEVGWLPQGSLTPRRLRGWLVDPTLIRVLLFILARKLECRADKKSNRLLKGLCVVDRLHAFIDCRLFRFGEFRAECESSASHGPRVLLQEHREDLCVLPEAQDQGEHLGVAQLQSPGRKKC